MSAAPRSSGSTQTGNSHAKASGATVASSVGPSRMPASTSPITWGWPSRPATAPTPLAASMTAAMASMSCPKTSSAPGGRAPAAASAPAASTRVARTAPPSTGPDRVVPSASHAARASWPSRQVTGPSSRPWRRRSSPRASPGPSRPTNWPDCSSSRRSPAAPRQGAAWSSRYTPPTGGAGLRSAPARRTTTATTTTSASSSR